MANTKQGPIVILDIGKDNKARAGMFPSGDESKAVAVAAAVMGHKVGRVETPEALALIKRVPAGKAFASGNQLLPIIKRELYDRLLKALTLFDPLAVSGKSNAEGTKGTQEAAKAIEPSTSQQANKAAATPTPSAKTAPMSSAKFTQPVIIPKARPNDPWALVTTGSTVLFTIDPKEGWYPCRVKRVSPDGRTLLLQWRDFPKLPLVEARRIAVGLVAKIP